MTQTPWALNVQAPNVALSNDAIQPVAVGRFAEMPTCRAALAGTTS
jgi:hypothetical protein